jgi:hypothetical protein
MKLARLTSIGALGAAMALSLAAQAQQPMGAGPGPNAEYRQWPGGGPGPYGPYAAPRYAAGNPYARELNELAVKDPEKHDACFTQANEKNLRRDARWKFMLECMKK